MVYCEYIFDIQNIDTGIGMIKYFSLKVTE